MQKIKELAARFDDPEDDEDKKSTDWDEEDTDTKAMSLDKRDELLRKIGI